MPACSNEFCTANSVVKFQHVKSLFFKEEHLPLKVAFKLRKYNLNPNNVARTSLQHASSKIKCTCEM